MELDDVDTSDSDKECLPSSALIEKLASVKDRMKLYPSYELHMEKITILKEIKDISQLIKTYEEFSKAFPLTTESWLDWINILTEKQDSEDEVLQLFSTAVKDYLCVPVWVSYINYASLCLNDEMRNTNWMRKIYEEALLLPALHVKEGINIWNAAINFEKRMYAFCKEEEQNPSNEVTLKEHCNRVLELYQRMLSCPLFGIEEEYSSFIDWITENEITVDNLDEIIENFNNSKKKLAAVIPHEKKLERCSETDIFKYNLFPKYIDYIQNHLDASTAQISCLYERMIEQFPIESSAWMRYLEFLKSVDTSKVLSVAERSVRNCPYNGELRVEYIKSLEKDSEVNTIKELYDAAMEIPYEDPLQLLTVWKNYINFLVKLHTEGTDCSLEMEKLFLNTLNVFNEYFFYHKSNSRAQFLIEWAEVKTNIFNDLQSARDVWTTKILVKKDKSSGNLWAKYLDFEKKYGTLDTLREAYGKAMTCVHQGAKQISEKWLEFEKQNGSSEQLNEAIRRCELRLQNMGVADHEHSRQDGEKLGKGQKQTFKNAFQPRSLTVKPNDQKKTVKRKIDSNKEGVVNAMEGTDKKIIGQEQPEKSDTSQASKNTNLYMPATIDEQRTVFLSNLDFTVTEEELKSLFEKAVGPIENIKLKKDFRGRSKGFGYILYQSNDSVEMALKMDHTVIKGRPVFVSKYNADKNTRKHFFAFSNSEEKNKLFVRGLSYNTTRESLMELFSKYGTVKDIRLVTFRDGRPKGLAYVDFESEEEASYALEATNGIELDSRKIFVAISQPSLGRDRLPAEEPIEKLIRKSVTSLIPSNVKIPQKKPKLDLETILPSSRTSEDVKISQNDLKFSVDKTKPEKTTGLSNADFRSMLLKKK